MRALGINAGALFGPLLTGLTRSTLGFHYAFGVAAIGMAAGLIQYPIGRRNLGAEASIVPNPLPRSRWTMVAGAAVGCWHSLPAAVHGGVDLR